MINLLSYTLLNNKVLQCESRGERPAWFSKAKLASNQLPINYKVMRL